MAVLIKRESKKEYVLSSRNDEELANDEKRKKGLKNAVIISGVLCLQIGLFFLITKVADYTVKYLAEALLYLILDSCFG
jgi:hypothetical protein